MRQEIKAYKLMRRRANGTLGPLFINCRQIVPFGKWLPAEDHPTKGYAHRPGWHVTLTPEAPHLSMRGRVWVQVRVRAKGLQELHRPRAQGGKWLLATWMKAERLYIGAVS
jgi:hypothetical protein